jgi:hypothetical protein
LFAQFASEHDAPRPAQARAYMRDPDRRPQGRGKAITV